MAKKKSDPIIREVSAKLSTILKAAFDSTIQSPPKHTLRVSGLPYCPILALEANSSDGLDEWNFEADFYVRIGTAVHELMQHFLPKTKYGGRVFGNWFCPICNKKWSVCFNPGTPKQRGCTDKHCPIVPTYREINFVHKGLDSGHTDMVFRIPVKQKNTFHLLDFKTTSDFLFDKPDIAKRYFPNKKHIIQVETYCALMWKVYRIRIHSCSIVYMSRHRATTEWNGEKDYRFRIYSWHFTKPIYRLRMQQLQRAIAGKREVDKALSGIQNAQKIYDLRPCLSKTNYLNYMHHGFFKDECPYYEDGSCFKERNMVKYIDSMMKEGT